METVDSEFERFIFIDSDTADRNAREVFARPDCTSRFHGILR